MKGFRLLPPLVVLWTICLLTPSVTAAESWGASLFSIKRHDFGRVAIGADAEFRFEMQNPYVEDVRILSVNSSCGCTAASVSTRLLKSTEKGAVIAKLNTSGQHTREKSATLSVLFETTIDGRTLQDMVQLFVTAYIRPDVVLTPGIVEFGSVPEGRAVERTVRLEYAGRTDWALTKIERNNPYVHARAVEVKRSGGDVVYDITATLKADAPHGYVRDALRFVTNETRAGLGEPLAIVLPIQGFVMASIHAKPSPFMVGLVTPGESVSKSIVVRSETPFRILEVDSEDKRFRFTFSGHESHIQIVSVLFSARDSRTPEPVDLAGRIQIRTSLPDQEFVTIETLARLAPKTSDEPPTPPAINAARPVGDGKVKFGAPRM